MSNSEIMKEVSDAVDDILIRAKKTSKSSGIPLMAISLAAKRMKLLESKIVLRKEKLTRDFLLKKTPSLNEKISEYDEALLYLKDLHYDLDTYILQSEYEDGHKFESSQKKYIKWEKNEELLYIFINLLIEKKLIEEIAIDEAKKHFIFEDYYPLMEPEPFIWVHNQINLLAYLIRQLQNNGFIDPKNIWEETAHHFKYQGYIPSNLRQSEDAYENRTKSGKPKNHEVIDKIVYALLS